MAEARILPSARDDLIEIEIYLSLNASGHVERMMRRLGEKIRLLAGQPMLGRVRSDLRSDDLRSFRERPYLIFYRTLEKPAEGVEVVRVLHESRDIDAEFEAGR